MRKILNQLVYLKEIYLPRVGIAKIFKVEERSTEVAVVFQTKSGTADTLNGFPDGEKSQSFLRVKRCFQYW